MTNLFLNKNKVFAIILLFLCQACVKNYGFESNPIKYNQLPEDKGIVIFRPLPLKETEYEKLYDVKMSTFKDFYTTWKRFDSESKKIDNEEFRLSLPHRNTKSILNNIYETATYQRVSMRYGAQEFYRTYVLKPGIYFLEETRISDGSFGHSVSYINQFEHKPTFYFTIKPNQVAYIGDFLAAENKHASKDSSIFHDKTKYTVNFKVVDKFDEAQQYFKTTFPSLANRVEKSLIQCCRRFD